MPSTTPPRQGFEVALEFQGWACIAILVLCIFMLVLVYWGDVRSIGGRHIEGVTDVTRDDLESQTGTERLNSRRTIDLVSETTPLLPAGASDLTSESTVVGSSPSSAKRTDSDLSSCSAGTLRSGKSSSVYGAVRESER
ncbi:hypothetical protein MMYC01_206533 [Madurella mycetomatis]|uniref:Uncharacterized protein n=1 Tax=Madurella mycetomatis TaxID=100816 RepID=A0A175VZH7_9PEZI|nr:hypothetical protein MMYC01_206533 [Madurella mycetomatis]